MNSPKNLYRGEIYKANLDPFAGLGQGSTRPVLILQNNIGDYYLPTVVVAPIKAYADKLSDKSAQFALDDVDFLRTGSVVMLNKVEAVDKRRLKGYLGTLDEEQMRKINACLETNLGFYIPEDPEFP